MQPDSSPDDRSDTFAGTLVDQIFELWVGPELTSRGLSVERSSVAKVVVEMAPDKPPNVRINEDADIVVEMVMTRDVVAGEEVAVSDIREIASIRPADVSPNSGWICFAQVAGQQIVAFDFTYNRERASALLDRAREFLAAATHASLTAPGVAVENAHSAAELSVQASMLLQAQETNSHVVRRRWLAGWAELENTPLSHAKLLTNLASLRDAARYGSRELRLKPGRMATILATVQEMIDEADSRLRKRTS